MTRLTWPDGSSAEYNVAGGMCFPVETPVPTTDGTAIMRSDIRGAAVLAIQDIATGVLEVVEECEYVSIDPLVIPGIELLPDPPEIKPLAPWLARVWSKYFGNRFFYWHGDQGFAASHKLKLYRSPMVMPKPVLIEAPWVDDDYARTVVWSHVRARDLVIPRDGLVYTALGRSRQDDKAIYPALHALQCLLLGLDRAPWRDYAAIMESARPSGHHNVYRV